jgi:hypothetical protein
MLLENLSRLHDEQNNIRAQSLDVLAQAPNLLDHAAIIEHWMDVILFFATQYDTNDEDELTLQRLGIRLFNTSACALSLALSGFYQNAALQMRDLLETGFLVDDFSIDRSTIKQWRESTDKERKKRFSPIEVRKRLDARDGLTTNGRAAAYSMFSDYASHPTHRGIALIYPDELGKIGPFFHLPFLTLLIEELAKRLLDPTITFANHFPCTPGTRHVHKDLLAKTNRWGQKYMPLQTPAWQTDL